MILDIVYLDIDCGLRLSDDQGKTLDRRRGRAFSNTVLVLSYLESYNVNIHLNLNRLYGLLRGPSYRSCRELQPSTGAVECCFGPF